MSTWLATLPTTNLRILMTLILAFATGVKVVWPSTPAWEPSWEWLGFLCVWAGLDVVQYTSKRLTEFKPTP